MEAAPSDLRGLHGDRGRARAPGVWRGHEATVRQWGPQQGPCGAEEEVPDQPQCLETGENRMVIFSEPLWKPFVVQIEYLQLEENDVVHRALMFKSWQIDLLDVKDRKSEHSMTCIPSDGHFNYKDLVIDTKFCHTE